MRRSEMMENKLWTVLCALLLLLTVNLGSTEDGNVQAAASLSDLGEKVSTGAPAADSAPAPILEPTSHPAPALNGSDTNTSSSGTGSLSSNTTKEEEITTQAPVPEEKNDTNIASPTVPAVPEKSSNQTDDLSMLTTPQTLPDQTTTSQTTTASTSQTTTTSLRHDTPVDTTTINSSNYPTSPTPDSISTSKQPGEPKTHPPTSAPTPEPPKPETTITTTTTTATSTQSKSTSSTSSSQESPNTPTSPHTSQSHAPRGQAKSTTTAPSSSSTPQAKAHADTPSQLNVGGDTMMVHESPTLDPLLAGLVTAFIITAVVITLLLFLKLRRRDNRPEFRRLQDLPMDDMMEDTPLSMYSY